LNPDVLGYFDTVLFGGVHYYLRYPMLGLDNIRRVATGDVFPCIEADKYDVVMRRWFGPREAWHRPPKR